MKATDLNTDFLRDNYLFGIPLQDIYGNKMKEGLLQHYVDAAIQKTQRMLQIVINPIDIEKEKHDYYANEFMNWGYIQLYKKPIIEVTNLSMYFGEQKMLDIPKEWFRTTDISGQLQIFPTSGSTGGMVLTQSGSFMPMILGLYNHAPQMWNVSYKAGMESEIPDDLGEYIMKRASVGVLQVWGDLIIGAGIANQTISLDGLSQSIGTTQSPEFTGAGARIKTYTDDLRELEKTLKDTYLGLNMVVV